MAFEYQALLRGYESASRMLCRPPRSKGAYIPRVKLVARLLHLLEKGVIPVLYGPRGAGKSTLLRCLAEVGARYGLRIVYVSLYTSPPISLGELPASLERRLARLSERDAVRRGTEIASIAAELTRLGGLLIIDGFDAGLGEGGAEGVIRAVYEYSMSKGTVPRLILVTSEASVLQRTSSLQVGNVVLTLLWHMGREEHEELARELGYRGSLEEIYGLTGGSPQALVSLAELDWDIDAWLDALILPVVEEATAELARLGVYLDNLDPDYLGTRPAARYILLKRNMLTRLVGVRLSDVPKSDWVGVKWAWQLPAYKRLMEEKIIRH